MAQVSHGWAYRRSAADFCTRGAEWEYASAPIYELTKREAAEREPRTTEMHRPRLDFWFEFASSYSGSDGDRPARPRGGG